MKSLRVIIFISFGLVIACDTKDSISPEESYFLKYYGNAGNQVGVDFAVNDDGSIFILGNSRAPSSNQQIYVARVGLNGKIMWERTVGLGLDEEAKDIEISFDKSNIIVVGNSEKAKGERDVFLMRLTLDGVPIDSIRQGLKLTNGTEADDNAYSVTQIRKGLTNPAGFIVAGATTGLNLATVPTDKTDPMHLRFDNNLARIGDATWASRLTFNSGGYPGEEAAVKVIQLDNNSYYIFGYSNNNESGSIVGDFNFLRYGRTDDGGSFGSLRNKGLPNTDEKLNSVSISPSQLGLGYMLSGISQNTTDGDSYLVKLSSPLSWNDSDISFETKINLTPGKSNPQRSVNSSSLTNGYFVASDQVGVNGTEMHLAKLDNTGNLLFERVFGGIGDHTVGAVSELTNGKIVLVGTMTLGGVVDGQKKIVLIKLNPQGKLSP